MNSGQSRRLNLTRTGWTLAVYETAMSAALMRALIRFIEDEQNSQLPRWLASSLAGQRLGRRED